MKLFYSPGACSLASHIAAREGGIDIKLEKVDLRSKQTAGGSDYLKINPKGAVPALEFDDGQLLTEGTAVLQYLADQATAGGLAPAAGSIDHYRLLEMLGFINSEIHKAYAPLFNPQLDEKARANAIAVLQKKYSVLEDRLKNHSYLVGEGFSVVDAYAFTVTRWAAMLGVDLAAFPSVLLFQKRIETRPAVQAALKAETAGT